MIVAFTGISFHVGGAVADTKNGHVPCLDGQLEPSYRPQDKGRPTSWLG
ncbi:hypothetical protein O1L55_27280 [Streptomyces albulus]|nr:hypothetical protein [Streptomyces noursei]